MDKANSGTSKTVSRRYALKGIASAVIAAPLSSSLLCGRSPVLNERASAAEPEQAILEVPISETFTVGQFLLDISKTSIRVRHVDDRTRSLWESVPSQPLIEAAIGDATFREHGDPLGYFDVTDKISSLSSFRSFDSVEAHGAHKIRVVGTLTGSAQNLKFHVVFDAVSANQLQFTLDVESGSAGQYNRIFLNYASSPDEAFFGFGQQLTYFNQKGNVIPILVPTTAQWASASGPCSVSPLATCELRWPL